MAEIRKYAKHSSILWEFRDSEQEQIEVAYESVEAATIAQKSMCNRLRYKKIHDIIIKRRKAKLYLMRNKEVLKSDEFK